MKNLQEIRFSAEQCARELKDFRGLLNRSENLQEEVDLRPFFQRAQQLCAFIGTYMPDIGPANLLAYEFQVAGDFVADIVVGNRETQQFCMIELEDASAPGIFVSGHRRITGWNPRFEHGFSQLVDWFYALVDLKGTERFARDFGYGHPIFHGLLVIGRSQHVSEEDRNRLRWRSERVLVDSHPIHCITYDELHLHLERRLGHYPAAAREIESGSGSH